MSQAKKTYTVKEVTTMFNFSREYLRQLRNGWHDSVKLKEGTDWYWERGKIVYTNTAINKLKKRSKG